MVDKLDCKTGDVSNTADVKKLTSYLKEKYGVLHGVINCAGVLAVGSLETISVQDWQKMMAINLTSPFLLAKSLLPMLKHAKGASIINISSIASLRPGTSIAYSVSKAGLDMLTKFLAGDLGPYKIRVNSINPGLVRTNIHFDNNIIHSQTEYETMIEAARVRHPIGRIGEPTDIANMVNFLLSEKASWISGAIIPVDGGVMQENTFIPSKKN